MLHRTRTLAVSILITLLTACGGGGGEGGTTPPPPDAVPTGYYDNTGTATLDTGNVADLQGIIDNNRLMMLSTATGFSYDGSITVSGNNYSGTLSVYDNGTLVGTAPVTGTITQGTSVSGTLTGTGAGSGSFQLLYAANNGEAAALPAIQGSLGWRGHIGGSTSGLGFNFAVDASGNVIDDVRTTDGAFAGCGVVGPIAPISGTHLYVVSVTLSSCRTAANGNYTGLAALRTSNRLFFMVTNGSFSLSNEFYQ